MSIAVDPPRAWTLPAPSNVASVVCVAAVGALALVERQPAWAVYGLSFWHYYLYWLAYRYGAVAQAVFQRDAVLMKTTALGLLAWLCFQTPLNVASLALALAGFGLNSVAAAVLGADRTYYGRELTDLPELRVTSFPYSWISHPMLVGNMLGYGATLLNFDFARRWWPLPVAHLALNVGLLGMELYVRPLRLTAPASRRATSRSASRLAWAAVAFAAAALGALAARQSHPWTAAALGGGLAIYAGTLFECYTARKSSDPATER